MSEPPRFLSCGEAAGRLCIAIAALCFSSLSHGADWPQWRGPDESGIAREPVAPNSDIEILWESRIGKGFSGVSVANGLAYTMGSDGSEETVWCFDADSGELRWKDSYSAALLPNLHEGGPASSPTITGDRLFTMS